MNKINRKIQQISHISDHYLVKANKLEHPYYREFLNTADLMEKLLSDKEFEFWCNEKMLLKNQTFNEKTFIQYAVETSVANYFGEKFPDDFEVEIKINPNNDKDVDCHFQDENFKFNIEVKCSDFKSKEKTDSKDAFKYETGGRLPDRGKSAIEAISKAIDEGLSSKNESLKEHVESKKMDNNLKDFLELAHDKFNPTPNETEINILLVGCDDERDIQNWFNYLWQEQGLFTDDSFANKDNYKNVDLVVFTNLYYLHNNVLEKKIYSSWTLQQSFNLIFENPFRKLPKEKGINHFFNILPNSSKELGKYEVSGDVPEYVKDLVRIPHFVKDYLERQNDTYLFGNR